MKQNIILLILLLILSPLAALAQPRPGGAPQDDMSSVSWQVTVRQMPQEVKDEITQTMERLQGTDDDRGILSDLGIGVAKAVGLGATSSLVDIIISETFNLAQYRQKQKQEWMRMIQNENNFTDSIVSIKGNQDFYSKPSKKGALDPSDINFDGIEIRGMRGGQEVIYMSCSIDRSKLDHMFRHSKFNLVLDTLAFYPYQCHLPNLTANGIRLMNEMKRQEKQGKKQDIVRPGVGGNGFSFDERENLNVAIDFSLFSSWINQAVQVHRDVELGTFRFNMSIPGADQFGVYRYSRADSLAKAATIVDPQQREMFLQTAIIPVEGDSFVVPRSYMPLDNGRPTWGTGEYTVKIKIRESCQLAPGSEKSRNWKEDYRRLCQMQKRGSEVQEYFRTFWKQYGNTLLKTSYSTALKTTVSTLTSAAGAGAASGAKAGGAPAGGAPAGGAPESH